MDTRTKIVSAAEAGRIAAEGATVVSGYFDPVLAAHAGRLRELKRPGVPLLVVIADPDDPILPTRARAELVAGLAVVDHVAESAGSLIPSVHLEDEHLRRRDELIARVHARQGASQ